MIKSINRRLVLLITILVIIISFANARTLRVLAIGNSFSEDAVEQDLYSLSTMGGQEIIIGNLYYPACTIERHWNNLKKEKGEYSYRKININGKSDTIPNCTMQRALVDEPWDIITFQQGSAMSGVYSSYRFVPLLLKRVREIVGVRPKFLWHQTWAYSPNTNHAGFKKYSGDQMRMFASILYCTKKVLSNNPELSGLIPSGTAIQDARTALGPDLTRDGYHLDLITGRYIASCTWYETLFSKPVSLQTFLPLGMTIREGEICRKAAEEAVKHPFEIVDLKKLILKEEGEE